MHHNEINLKIAEFTCEKCPDSQDPEEGDDKLPEGCEFMKELCDRFDYKPDSDGVPVTLKDMKNALEEMDSEEVEDAIREKTWCRTRYVHAMHEGHGKEKEDVL